MRRYDLGGWIKSETVDIFLVLRLSNLLTLVSFLPFLILPQPLLDVYLSHSGLCSTPVG